MKANINDAQVTVLLEIEGQMHFISMQKDRYDAVSLLAKASAETAYPTGKSQAELNEFLGYKK